MTDATINLNCNVHIKVIDKNGKLVNERYIHNKATRSMVDSITQFLMGNFNPTQFSDPADRYANADSVIINNAYAAKRYLPSCTGMGDIGVDTTDHELSIDNTLFTKPSFFDTSLQQEYPTVPRIQFRRVRQIRGYDINNSEGLAMTTILPIGYALYEYVNGEAQYDGEGNPVYRNDYFWYYGENGDASEEDKKKAVAITEIGLFSNTDKDNGLLLARVLLDGALSSNPQKASKGVMENPSYEYNPLIQTEDTSVVIEWKIGIISIGTNDEFITVSDINLNGSEENSNEEP